MATRWVVFESLAGYRPQWLRADVVAGLTVWAVLVPEALAYASIAGVPPVVGLYAAIPSLILYAAAGSSRHLVVGPMSATAALSAAIVTPMAGADGGRYIALSAALAIATGVAGLLAGAIRLGFVAAFISEPVLKGFIVGLALTIIIGQVPKLFGIPKHEGDFFEQAWGVLTRLGDIQWRTLVVGVVSLAIVLVSKRWLPLIPGSLLAVLVGIAAVGLFDLDHKGVAIVGHIDAGLPSVGLPGVEFGDFVDLLGPAVGVLLIGFAEGLGAAKTYAARAGYQVDANRELLGLGAANLGAGLASGMVVNGSLSKTAVNGSAGAKTQVSSLVVAGLTVLTLLFLTGLFDTLPGLLVGIGISMLLLVYRTSRPHVVRVVRSGTLWVDADRHPEIGSRPDLLVVRVESGLFFANADHVREQIQRLCTDHTRMVVLDAETSPSIDVTAAAMLADLRRDLGRRGIDFRIARSIGQFGDALTAAESRATAPGLYPTVSAAVADLPPSNDEP
ncbi:SulP family inorganic anion transporter [Nocardia veterana]|uniref:SulP family inorganic anion transporter n=1 Tax=Nocardia veterana TaxID=132249 RepID=UPI001FE09F8C|nr:SulP family inorganic anion transporter [Nocardia veterana]